jgi:hypothetical protein
LFGWLNIRLERREYHGEDELYEAMDKSLSGLSIEMIETVFVDWISRLQQLNDGNSEYVSEKSQVNF